MQVATAGAARLCARTANPRPGVASSGNGQSTHIYFLYSTLYNGWGRGCYTRRRGANQLAPCPLFQCCRAEPPTGKKTCIQLLVMYTITIRLMSHQWHSIRLMSPQWHSVLTSPYAGGRRATMGCSSRTGRLQRATCRARSWTLKLGYTTGQAPTARRRRETRAHTVTRSHIDEPHNHPETIPTHQRTHTTARRPNPWSTRGSRDTPPVTCMGLDGCEVRLCGRPRVPCVPGSPRCLFAGR